MYNTNYVSRHVQQMTTITTSKNINAVRKIKKTRCSREFVLVSGETIDAINTSNSRKDNEAANARLVVIVSRNRALVVTCAEICSTKSMFILLFTSLSHTINNQYVDTYGFK